MGIVYLHFVLLPTCFRQIDSDKTLQVLQQRHERCRWRRRFTWSAEPVTAAGRVGFFRLFTDPSRGVAKSSWCQVAQFEEGKFQRVPCREKWLNSWTHSCFLRWEVVVWVRVDLALVAVSTFFRQINADKALQVLQRRNARSRWSTTSSASIESVDTAGRVEFWLLFSDPSRGLAKTSGRRLAEAAEGRWHPEGGAPKASTWRWRRHASDTFDFDAWNCSRWQSGTGGTEASQNRSRSRLGCRCDGTNGTFELFAHWSLGSSQLSWDPGSRVAKTAWCQVASLEDRKFPSVPGRENWLHEGFLVSYVYLFVSAGSCPSSDL